VLVPHRVGLWQRADLVERHHFLGRQSPVGGGEIVTQLRDNLAAASWRLSAEEMTRLDEVSALPEPYPMWHQHKFGIERNARLPSMRGTT